MIETDFLKAPGIAHGFFTRQGGVSSGVYATLNGGTGSRDAPDAVAENRRRMAIQLGVAPTHFLVPYQVHSADAIAVAAPWEKGQRPRADAIVTATRGLGLGVTGADCGIVLLADADAGVVGAAHAGWRGALGGVLEATLAAMEGLGAALPAIRAVLGPTIGPASYEVGPEFVEQFAAAGESREAHFRPAARPGHAMFDLPGYILTRLARAGVGRCLDLELDTYADAERFFSYRRSVHRAEPDYGRLIAAIALT